MALDEYMSKSKDSLARLASRAETAARSNARKQDETLALVGDIFGAGVTAPLGAITSGYIETRFPNKDGTPLSLGPVPFPAMIGLGAVTAGAFLPGARRQLTHFAAGQFGLAAGTIGRAYGVIHKAKSDAEKHKDKDNLAGTEGTGAEIIDTEIIADYDDGTGNRWTDAETELLAE